MASAATTTTPFPIWIRAVNPMTGEVMGDVTRPVASVQCRRNGVPLGPAFAFPTAPLSRTRLFQSPRLRIPAFGGNLKPTDYVDFVDAFTFQPVSGSLSPFFVNQVPPPPIKITQLDPSTGTLSYELLTGPQFPAITNPGLYVRDITTNAIVQGPIPIPTTIDPAKPEPTSFQSDILRSSSQQQTVIKNQYKVYIGTMMSDSAISNIFIC